MRDRETISLHGQEAVEKLERKIQKLLLDFENETGLEVGGVEVDTRVPANLRTQVFLRKKPHVYPPEPDSCIEAIDASSKPPFDVDG